MRHLDDLSGREIGIYKILKFSHMKQNGENKKHGMSYYLCECKKCGKKFIIARSELVQGKCAYHQGECL